MSDTPEIIDTDAEQEILFSRVVRAAERSLRSTMRPGLSLDEHRDAIAAMAVTAVLETVRLMSGRQLAVLLAQEANRHKHIGISEPPHYTAGELAQD